MLQGSRQLVGNLLATQLVGRVVHVSNKLWRSWRLSDDADMSRWSRVSLTKSSWRSSGIWRTTRQTDKRAVAERAITTQATCPRC